jgi:hypothetical protein
MVCCLRLPVIDGGCVVSACVSVPKVDVCHNAFPAAVTTANDLGPGGDVFGGEAVTL